MGHYTRKEGNKNYNIVPFLEALWVGAWKTLHNEAQCSRCWTKSYGHKGEEIILTQMEEVGVRRSQREMKIWPRFLRYFRILGQKGRENTKCYKHNTLEESLSGRELRPAFMLPGRSGERRGRQPNPLSPTTGRVSRGVSIKDFKQQI